MKRRRKITLIALLLLALVVAFLILQPGPSYDISRVDPRCEPFKRRTRTFWTEFFWDGGSIGIEITDRDGAQQQFAIPAHLGDARPYSRVFVGALYDSRPGAVEIAEPEDTKRMLVCILRDSSHRDANDDACLMSLRRYPKDFARVLYHKLCGDYEWNHGGACDERL